MCGTGPLNEKMGVSCTFDDPCNGGVCDNNTPNALNSYCTRKCKDISDCPCDEGGHVWECKLDPKLGAVVEYCIDNSKY